MNHEQLTLRCCLGKKSRLNDSFSNRKTRTRINPRRTNCLWNELRRKIFLWNGFGGSIDYSMEDIKNLRLSSELAYSLDWTETSLFENFRVGVRWGKVCFLMDSKFGFTSSCWRKKPGWFVLLKSANCYCSKAFVCRHREVLRKEVDLLTGGGWNRTRPKLLTTGLQWVLPILHYLRWIFPLDCPWGMRLSYAYSELRLSLNICFFFLTDRNHFDWDWKWILHLPWTGTSSLNYEYGSALSPSELYERTLAF